MVIHVLLVGLLEWPWNISVLERERKTTSCFFFSMVCVFCQHVCLCISCVPGVWRPEEAVGSPGNELIEMVVSHHEGMGN